MRIVWIAIALVAVILSAGEAHAQDRLALVIGNSAYKNTSRLANPKNDAKDIAALLSRMGFRVWLGLDLPRSQMG